MNSPIISRLSRDSHPSFSYCRAPLPKQGDWRNHHFAPINDAFLVAKRCRELVSERNIDLSKDE